MSRNGSGVYNPPGASFPAVVNTIIDETKYNSVINDIASEITNSIACDGQSSVANDIPMSNHKLTGLSAGSSSGHSVRYDELILKSNLAGDTFTGLVKLASAAAIASATTLDLTAATGNTVVITGTTTTTAITITAGQQMQLIAAAAWPLTHHATNLNINGGASYTCAAGDRIFVNKDSTGVVRVNVIKQDGTSLVATPGYAPLASPALTGNPTAPTPAAGDNDTSIATTAFVCSSGWFESSEQTITNNTLLSVSHGLGRIPKEASVIIRCKTTDLGYSVDDEVQFVIDEAPSAAQWAARPSLFVNSTTIGFYNTNIDILNRSTNNFDNITNASWRVVFRCR